MTEGFLGRWSQRKQAVREGKEVVEPVPVETTSVADHSPQPSPSSRGSHSQGSHSQEGNKQKGNSQEGNSQGSMQSLTPSPLGGEGRGEGLATAPEPARAPVLNLEDVQRLTAESNFAPFVARSVTPEVRNAAMKKLFTDPHYNVMDRLDIYIDDYSKPDPLPESMLRQMVGAKFLKLFEDEKTPKPVLRVDPHSPSADSMAESGQMPKPDAKPVIENRPQEQNLNHDHTDLQLQPNHAARRSEPGRGAG